MQTGKGPVMPHASVVQQRRIPNETVGIIAFISGQIFGRSLTNGVVATSSAATPSVATSSVPASGNTSSLWTTWSSVPTTTVASTSFT